jgi:DNA-binding transcriptional regulator YiaG
VSETCVGEAFADDNWHTDCSIKLIDSVLFLCEHRSMTSLELRAVLTDLDITQADFARLLGVTSRAVALWAANERAVPGPVEGYLRLLGTLPPHLRQNELIRLKQKGTSMRDGIFGVTYEGKVGAGFAMLTFDNGRVHGVDTERGCYDGEYLFDEASSLAKVNLKVTMPANVMSVFGIKNPYEWAVDVTASLDPKRDVGIVEVKNAMGSLRAQYKFLRALPDA